MLDSFGSPISPKLPKEADAAEIIFLECPGDCLVGCKERVSLAAGESKTITLKTPNERLALLNAEFKPIVEPGDFTVYVDELQTKFSVK